MPEATNSTGDGGNGSGAGSAESAPPPFDLLDVKALAAAGRLLGIAGAGGGGFVALTFGIGYLAIKNHDAMIGMPTLSLNYTTYAREGALFFPNSLYYLFTATAYFVVLACIAIVALQFATHGIRRRFAGRREVIRFVQDRLPERVRFAGLHVVLLLLAVYVGHMQIAAFDPVNKKLMFLATQERTSEEIQSFGRRIVKAICGVTRLDDTTLCMSTNEVALGIRHNLTDVDGAAPLHRLYGIQLGLTLLLVFGIVVLRRWRKRIGDHGVTGVPSAESPRPPSLTVLDWMVYPILGALTLALVLNTPANYGILCLPRSKMVVYLDLKDKVCASQEDSSASGQDDDVECHAYHLLSDLSTEPDEVWTGRRIDGRWAFHVFKRENIQEIRLTEHGSPNIIAVEVF